MAFVIKILLKRRRLTALVHLHLTPLSQAMDDKPKLGQRRVIGILSLIITFSIAQRRAPGEFSLTD